MRLVTEIRRVNFFKAFLYFIAVCVMVSCNLENRPILFKSSNEMSTFINDKKRGFIKEIHCTNNILMQLRYQPVELLPGYDDTNGGMRDKLFFVLSLSYKGKELLAQIPQDFYSIIMQTLSFNMASYIKLRTDDQKSHRPLTVQFQPTYNLGNSNDLLVVFDKKLIENGEKIRIELEDYGLQTGKQVFKYSVNDLHYLTSLRIKNSI